MTDLSRRFNYADHETYLQMAPGGIFRFDQDPSKLQKLQLIRERVDSSQCRPSQDAYRKYIATKVDHAPIYTPDETWFRIRERQTYNTENLYDYLQLTPYASFEEIRHNYRRLALQFHPDKGGDPEAFGRIQAAYEILSDEFLRNVYDNSGLEEALMYKNNYENF